MAFSLSLVDAFATSGSASASFNGGIFERTPISSPYGSYLRQTQLHLENGYPEVLKIYKDAQERATNLFKRMEEITDTFTKKVLNELQEIAPDLEIQEKDNEPKEIEENEFTYAVRGKLLEAIFKEMLNRCTSNHTSNFRIGSPTVVQASEENGRYDDLTYFSMDIPGWNITVAYSTDQTKLKKIRESLNRLMLEPTVTKIIGSYFKLQSDLAAINTEDLKKFDAELCTILDAAEDDNFIMGRGLCGLCAELV